MLTIEKIELFKKYKGYYDGYYLQNKDSKRIITDEEWSMLSNFMQELFLQRKGLASKNFADATIMKLKENCENESVFNFVLEVEKYING